MLALLATAIAAPCDPTALVAALDEAEAAWTLEAPERLGALLPTIRANRGCGDPRSVARAFRVEALEAHATGDTAGVRRSLSASLAAHPLLEPLPSMRSDPELFAAWVGVQEQPVEWRVGASQLVNGLRTPLVPRAERVGGHSRARGMRIGVGLGLLAGGLYAAAWTSRARFDAREGHPAADRLPSYRATNGLTLASVSVAAASASVLVIHLRR